MALPVSSLNLSTAMANTLATATALQTYGRLTTELTTVRGQRSKARNLRKCFTARIVDKIQCINFNLVSPVTTVGLLDNR